MLGDPFEHVAQIGFRVEVIEFGCSNQCINGSGSLAPIIRPCEKPVLSLMHGCP